MVNMTTRILQFRFLITQMATPMEFLELRRDPYIEELHLKREWLAHQRGIPLITTPNCRSIGSKPKAPKTMTSKIVSRVYSNNKNPKTLHKTTKPTSEPKAKAKASKPSKKWEQKQASVALPYKTTTTTPQLRAFTISWMKISSRSNRLNNKKSESEKLRLTAILRRGNW